MYEQLNLKLLPGYPQMPGANPLYRDFRAGGRAPLAGRHWKSATLLGYQPSRRIGERLKVAMQWYVKHLTKSAIRH